MANVIVKRVQEFLKRFPPFSFLKPSDLELVASQVEVQFLAKEEILFKKNEAARPHFYILKEGQIGLYDQNEIKDYCDEGDVFGVLALLGKRPYIYEAKVEVDSLVYSIPVSVFEEILEKNSKVALYFAAGFASGQVVVRQDLSTGQKARGVLKKDNQDHSLLIFSDPSQIQFSERVIHIDLNATVQEAAQKMASESVSSIVVCGENQIPLGIITDKDLRSKVVAQALPLNTKVDHVMSSPVITKKKDAGFSDLYLSMIKNRLHHLILTEDGSPNSPICGILSDHDVLLSMGNSPAVLIHALLNTEMVSEMKSIRDRAETMLKYYLENEVSMDFVASVLTEINDVIIQQAVKIAQNKLSEEFPQMKSIRFVFLCLGSEGREEQLLRTDLDNAILYEDVPKELEKIAADYFLQLGTEVVEILLACGFSPCPGEIMASNPKWNQPLSRWKKYFSDWILTPTPEALLRASIFYDFRPIAGFNGLSEELSLHVYENIQKKKGFLSYLGQNAFLSPPPLGFFKDFIVEKSQEHRDQFDIKARAMMPLTDLARLLILSYGVVGINNTFKRFEKLCELEPQNAQLFTQAGKAYEILMRMRALEGLENQNNGRYIRPENMGKLQRQLLKSTFAPISELQEIVRIRFQLDLLRS
ncbi:DUF294 nucleotidyltransferase-like domain-containing protein [Algoriphagus zhangzhouensis]|uniref:CBS domain-containing protein n=1 Tax=Algoriphagus zhangzhouensis TaxID=1073327 RepID=A0A1M7ZBC8_9BACT|nr:DUF294 nucleotidyltransferase-like domain-containing protein [Algoriphagus zhangzhouensis]TDY46830.1 CBS domain-containing protein [Algoriphagus zhangzhouensis]SHO62211.1 CBS domain-containing protein [Algoriphagus zhangzhouensis]